MPIEAHGPFREASISAVITRADGTVEDLGVIARWHKNPLKRLLWAMSDRFRSPQK